MVISKNIILLERTRKPNKNQIAKIAEREQHEHRWSIVKRDIGNEDGG